ncbi:cystathionine gamma-lyase [Arctopsyche grandis]|uniref:cystathionine gamma-lyase n=1 Tax=Arctopsyche grandis TaxID=121162 RepID=UPI00406D668F
MAENGFLKQAPGFATRAIHVGQEPERWNSYCVVPPLVTSTTFKQEAPAKHRGFEYGRSGNPTRNVLEECLASLEEAKYSLCFSSGLGATTCISSLLSRGDHIICGDDVYGGTNRLFRNVVARMGVELSFIDLQDATNLTQVIKPNTKMVWIETPTNPLLKIFDIAAISKILKEYPDTIFVVDNTFLTPYFQRPLELGADIVMYSLTKYMNGHSDVIMGAAMTSRDDLHERLRFLQNAMGIVPAPFDCYQVNRSLKTLAIRMQQHQKSSLLIAKWLESQSMVDKVIHPGLSSHPQHDLAKKQCYGHSGMLAFFIKGGAAQSSEFLKSLKVFTLAESLGGYESLAELPSVMTHASVPEKQRMELGITDSLVRLSVGLEDVQDLIEDLLQALDAASKVSETKKN